MTRSELANELWKRGWTSATETAHGIVLEIPARIGRTDVLVYECDEPRGWMVTAETTHPYSYAGIVGVADDVDAVERVLRELRDAS